MRQAARVVGYRFRSTFAHRRTGLLVIVLLIALVGGLALGAIAGARRTQSAYPAFLAEHEPVRPRRRDRGLRAHEHEVGLRRGNPRHDRAPPTREAGRGLRAAQQHGAAAEWPRVRPEGCGRGQPRGFDRRQRRRLLPRHRPRRDHEGTAGQPAAPQRDRPVGTARRGTGRARGLGLRRRLLLEPTGGGARSDR